MKSRALLYLVLAVLAIICFAAGQWAGALTALVLTLILVTLDGIHARLITLSDQLDYQTRQRPQSTLPDRPS